MILQVTILGVYSWIAFAANEDLGFYDPNVLYNTSRFEGDIIGIPLSNDTSGIKNAISDPNRLWPNGLIFYRIDSRLCDLNQARPLIVSTMTLISAQTRNCIRFRERRNESSYINIISGDGCYSQVGMIGGSQGLSLGRGCQVIGIILHELIHAVGFYHMHNRSDRDDYLRIYYENIIPSMISQFQKLEPSQNLIFTDFDYYSIMIYGSRAFSKNGISPTMEPLRPGVILLDPGYKSSLTQRDVISIRRLYRCA